MSGSAAGSDAGLQMKVGLVNHLGKYLTAETFGFKINASSATFRKKQLWTIEPDQFNPETVYIKSHLGRYLSGDKKGGAACASETRGPNEKFSIQYDGSGRWAFCNLATSYYFGGSEDNLQCYEKQPNETEWWWIHLDIHPHINLYSAGRQKYVRLSSDGRHLEAGELIPWGRDAIVELEFAEGRYCIKSCDGRYLSSDGNLVDSPSPDCAYTFETKTIGQLFGIAFKDSNGKYMTAIGAKAVVQSRNRTITKEEIFTFQDSQPQVTLVAHNQKLVSIKQGLDVSANQDVSELSDKETFQLESDKKTPQWRVRTADNQYWSMEAAGGNGIQAIGNASSPSGLFAIEYQEDGAVALRASTGRYVTARMNGSLYAVSDSLSSKELFTMVIINRPILVLRCEYGFVGVKSATNPRYECNKTVYDLLFVEPYGTAVHLKGNKGSYLAVDADGGITANHQTGESFILELRGHSKMAIRTANGNYIRGEQNGIISATAADLSKATLWEY